jgi:hypothetical protein
LRQERLKWSVVFPGRDCQSLSEVVELGRFDASGIELFCLSARYLVAPTLLVITFAFGNRKLVARTRR